MSVFWVVWFGMTAIAFIVLLTSNVFKETFDNEKQGAVYWATIYITLLVCTIVLWPIILFNFVNKNFS